MEVAVAMGEEEDASPIRGVWQSGTWQAGQSQARGIPFRLQPGQMQPLRADTHKVAKNKSGGAPRERDCRRSHS